MTPHPVPRCARDHPLPQAERVIRASRRRPVYGAEASRYAICMVPLSVLDLSPVTSGSSGTQALRNSLDLAELADRLGYTRYWLAAQPNPAPSASAAAP